MNKYLGDNKFFAEEIKFCKLRKKISQNEIDEIDDFPGKDDFIHFYSIYNGGEFIDGAWFFPEDCYNVFICNHSYIPIHIFLPISIDNMKKKNEMKGIDIESWKDVLAFDHKNYEDFMLFHMPFALDEAGNTFWIDIQTGEIKYTDDKACVNPNNDAVTVASSFKNFCKCIRNRDMN